MTTTMKGDTSSRPSLVCFSVGHSAPWSLGAAILTPSITSSEPSSHTTQFTLSLSVQESFSPPRRARNITMAPAADPHQVNEFPVDASSRYAPRQPHNNALQNAWVRFFGHRDIFHLQVLTYLVSFRPRPRPPMVNLKVAEKICLRQSGVSLGQVERKTRTTSTSPIKASSIIAPNQLLSVTPTVLLSDLL
jgi:hypothetical protein